MSIGFLVGNICIIFLNALWYAIFARIIMSWVVMTGRGEKLYNVLCNITDFILNPIRQLLMRIEALRNLPMDLSPIVAIFSIYLLIMFFETFI